MQNVHKALTLLAIVLFCSLTAPAARWRLGPQNVVEVREWGSEGKLTIGDAEKQTWFWCSALGISFHPDCNMRDDQTSKELWVNKTAGGKCPWGMRFHFTKTIDRFRFTTPKCSSLDLGSGDIVLNFSADEGPAKEIWRYSAKSPGYRKGGEIPPKTLDWIQLPKPVTNLTLNFVFEGFVGNMQFYDGVDDGGTLEYVSAVLPVEQMTKVLLIPDRSKTANVFHTGEPLRAVIDVGPKLLAEPPSLVAYDTMRKKMLTFSAQPFGTAYLAELSNLPAGCYEIRVHLKDDGKLKIVKGEKIIRIHPPRVLTWDEMHRSPFGVVAIDRNPEVVRLTGIHRMRGGSQTWCVGNPAKGTYTIDADPKQNTLDDLASGIIRYHSLAFSPGWTVDPKRVKPGDWSGSYPPKKEHLADYAEYCRRLTTATKGWYNPEFEVWNEPNNEPYGSFKGTFDEFVALCSTAADTVHAVNPKARMILGSTGDADVGYIVKLMKAGLAKKYQVVDIHPYRHTSQGPEDGLDVDIRRLKKGIELYGNNQGIMFSEVGWPTYAGGHQGYGPVTYFQQGCYFSRTMLLSIAYGVEQVLFHIYYDWKSKPNDPEANFGVVDFMGQPKPSLAALANTARHLEKTKFLGLVKNTLEFHHAWVWDTPWVEKSKLLAVWCDTVMLGKQKPQWIRLPAEPILAEDLWGERPDRGQLRKGKEGWEVLPGEAPIFIYLPVEAAPKDLAPLPLALRPWHLRRLDSVSMKDHKIDYDGDLKEWGDLPVSIEVDRQKGAGTMAFAGIGQAAREKKTEDQSRFKVGYNDQGLLIGVYVKSATPMKNDNSNWWIWAGDCVRVYVSTVDSQKVPFMSENHVQFGLAPVTTGNGPPQAVNIGYVTPAGVKSGDLIPGAKLVSKQLKDGWTIEALIPWTYFGKTPKPGDEWDFDLEAAGRCWNGSESNWHNPTRWGKMKFVQ